MAQTTVAVCNKDSRYYWSWYCGQKNVARSLFTAVLPPLLLMLWQSLVMPNVLYRFAWVSSGDNATIHCILVHALICFTAARLLLMMWLSLVMLNALYRCAWACEQDHKMLHCVIICVLMFFFAVLLQLLLML